MATNNGRLPAERQLAHSVKRGDQPGVFHVYIHSDRYRYTALPPQLPLDDGAVYWRNRHRAKMDILLSTPYHSAMWAAAVAKGIKKKASLAWEIDSEIAIRAKKARRWLLAAGAGNGIFGYVPFVSAGLRSYYGTGYQFIEIERAAAAAGTAVINVHHLNPKKCFLTGNPQKPVEYMSDDNEIRPLWWHDVIIITDMLSAVDDETGLVMGGTERSYSRIILDEGIEQYIYQKVTARRPSEIHFVGGAMGASLDDAESEAQATADQKGYTSFMGSIFVEVFGDAPLNIKSVSLFDIPEKTDINRERERSDLIYSHNLDIDPQDINPGLIGRQGLGSTGNQSLVLAQKEDGFKSWEQQFTHAINELALDDKTTFAFAEMNVRDQQAKADVRKTAVDTESTMIKAGIISPDEARNDLVDAGHLPPEYLKTDVTADVTVTDSTKLPETDIDGRDNEDMEEAETGATEKEYAAAVAAWEMVNRWD